MNKFLFPFYYIDRLIERISIWLVITAIFSMLLFTLAGIVLRWFSISFLWLDPFVRHVVFLSAFLGGVIATGQGRNICIDIIDKQLTSRNMLVIKRAIAIIISLVSFLTLLWLVHSSIGFVEVEFQYGKPPFFGISSGYLVAIIPVGFSLIAYRFFYIFLKHLFFIEEKQ